MNHLRSLSQILPTLTLCLLTFISCGKDSSKSEDIKNAPKISQSKFTGLAFTAGSIDQSIPTSSLYLYDFTAGKIKQLSSSESANATIFALDKKLVLFNRQANQTNYRVLEPSKEGELDAKLSSSTNIDLKAGDPYDVTNIMSDDVLVLSCPKDQNIKRLDTRTGLLTPVKLSKPLASGILRPMSFIKTNQKILVIHSGLNISEDGLGNSDNTQQAYPLAISADGQVSFVDTNLGTDAVDGLPLTASNPTSVINKSGSSERVIGLCNDRTLNCTAGVDLVDENTSKAIAKYQASESPKFVDQIIDGPDLDSAYGLVANAQGAKIIAKINLTNGNATVIHQFSKDRLFGLAYDSGSDTLFVGDQNENTGLLRLFRANKEIGSVEIEGVMYRAAFVP